MVGLGRVRVGVGPLKKNRIMVEWAHRAQPCAVCTHVEREDQITVSKEQSAVHPLHSEETNLIRICSHGEVTLRRSFSLDGGGEGNVLNVGNLLVVAHDAPIGCKRVALRTRGRMSRSSAKAHKYRESSMREISARNHIQNISVVRHQTHDDHKYKSTVMLVQGSKHNK